MVRFTGPPASALAAFGFVVNFLLGALLLLAAPDLSTRVVERVTGHPVRMGAIGVLIAIAVPIALFLLAITIIGLPFAIAGAVLFGLLLWIASVYGRFAVGASLVGYAGIDDRWIAFVVGLGALAALAAAGVRTRRSPTA